MQQFKPLYNDLTYQNTFSNIQRCLRLNDLDEIGDGTHILSFDMIGLYSFRQWSLKESIDFMIKFLKELNIEPDYVTIHPDKILEWSSLYEEYNFKIKPDPECIWSDGTIGGYCTEFYIDDIEIGNIVNPLGNCIDIGFGLERLLTVSKSNIVKSRLQILEETINDLINSGVTISDYKEGFILKKLITLSLHEGSISMHPYVDKIRKFQVKNYLNYLNEKQKPRHKNKDSYYWKNTFGIDEDKIIFYESLIKRI